MLLQEVKELASQLSPSEQLALINFIVESLQSELNNQNHQNAYISGSSIKGHLHGEQKALISQMRGFLKIEQQLAQLQPEQLSLVSDFLYSLQNQDSASTDISLAEIHHPLRRMSPIKRGSKAADLLKFAGTWQGDDLEECLKFVHETRSPTQF